MMNGEQFNLPMIDNGKLDRQHDYLVKLLRTFENKKDITRSEISSGMKALLLYSIEHFRCEEEMMRSDGYPEYEEHKLEHTKFFKVCSEICVGYKDIQFNEFSLKLRLWITDHICWTDLKYAKWRVLK